MSLELTITKDTDFSYYTVSNNVGHTYSMWGDDITKVSEMDDKVVLDWNGVSRDLTLDGANGTIKIVSVLGTTPETLTELRILLSKLRL